MTRDFKGSCCSLSQPVTRGPEITCFASFPARNKTYCRPNLSDIFFCFVCDVIYHLPTLIILIPECKKKFRDSSQWRPSTSLVRMLVLQYLSSLEMDGYSIKDWNALHLKSGWIWLFFWLEFSLK